MIRFLLGPAPGLGGRKRTSSSTIDGFVFDDETFRRDVTKKNTVTHTHTRLGNVPVLKALALRYLFAHWKPVLSDLDDFSDLPPSTDAMIKSLLRDSKSVGYLFFFKTIIILFFIHFFCSAGPLTEERLLLRAFDQCGRCQVPSTWVNAIAGNCIVLTSNNRYYSSHRTPVVTSPDPHFKTPILALIINNCCLHFKKSL